MASDFDVAVQPDKGLESNQDSNQHPPAFLMTASSTWSSHTPQILEADSIDSYDLSMVKHVAEEAITDLRSKHAQLSGNGGSSEGVVTSDSVSTTSDHSPEEPFHWQIPDDLNRLLDGSQTQKAPSQPNLLFEGSELRGGWIPYPMRCMSESTPTHLDSRLGDAPSRGEWRGLDI